MLTAAAGRDTVKKCLQKSRGWVGKKKGSEAPWEQVCFQRPKIHFIQTEMLLAAQPHREID